MYGKLQKNIGFALIIFAFFFLFEPVYSLVDPLPDFIGYAILCIALMNLSDINDRINDASRGFRRAMLLSILRFVSLIIVNKVFAEGENTIGKLIFVFVFAAFDIFIALPAYKSLFEGLIHLATFYNGEAVFVKKDDKKRNRTEKLYTFTSVFLISKNIICALPEFTSLETNSSYEFVNILRIFAIIIVLPLSIIWLVRMVTYFVAVRKDAPFIDSLTQKYIEKAESFPEYYQSRDLCTGLYAVLLACILTFDIYSGNVNYLPDLFFFAVLIISMILLKKNSFKWVPITIISSFGSLLSIFLYMTERSFFERHFIGAIKRDLEAYNHYYFMLSVYILQALILLIAVILLAFLLIDIVKKHIVKANAQTNKLPLAFVARLFAFIITGVVSTLATVWHIFALPYFKYGWLYEYSGIISSFFAISFVISSFALITYSVGEIKHYYKTDIL